MRIYRQNIQYSIIENYLFEWVKSGLLTKLIVLWIEGPYAGFRFGDGLSIEKLQNNRALRREAGPHKPTSFVKLSKNLIFVGILTKICLNFT